MNKVSYALGLSIGQNFRASGFDEINLDDFLSGVRDVLEGSEPQMTYDEAKVVINDYFQEVRRKAVEQNKEAGEEFLKINGHKTGVVTLPSGLQYEVIKMGDGAKPALTDTVECHYHGTLINGQVFDSSMDRGQTAKFPLQGVIKGWTEILQLMPVGSKWKVTIPSDLAYGDRGAGEMIQPGSTLIFIIELIAIVGK
ncbi:FKBP-type peptidyl-prolyl cis-trans isomerase [Porphyromonas sp.]